MSHMHDRLVCVLGYFICIIFQTQTFVSLIKTHRCNVHGVYEKSRVSVNSDTPADVCAFVMAYL